MRRGWGSAWEYPPLAGVPSFGYSAADPLQEIPLKETAPEAALTTPTRRPTVAALDEKIGEKIPVLDHGFVALVDYMGDDQAIVQAARVAYGRGTERSRRDTGRLRHLAA